MVVEKRPAQTDLRSIWIAVESENEIKLPQPLNDVSSLSSDFAAVISF